MSEVHEDDRIDLTLFYRCIHHLKMWRDNMDGDRNERLRHLSAVFAHLNALIEMTERGIDGRTYQLDARTVEVAKSLLWLHMNGYLSSECRYDAQDLYDSSFQALEGYAVSDIEKGLKELSLWGFFTDGHFTARMVVH